MPSRLTTFNLCWLMDLTFQVPMQYCSLQYRTLLPSPVISTTECCFCFGSVSSFFLELFLHWSLVAYWAPTYLEGSSFSVVSFCLFILFIWFSRQEHWSGLPFPSPVDHVLSELSTMTCPSQVALHGMAHSSIPYFVLYFFIVLPNITLHNYLPLALEDRRIFDFLVHCYVLST